MKAKKILTIIVLVILTSVSVGAPLFAAESQFIVGQQVVSSPDTTPPTIPTGLTATAVSSSQINLLWTASTDDTALYGYHVYRDSVLIATSTGVTYSDTGLTPATLYTYTISAVDTSYNESAQSAPASATTFAVQVVPPPVSTTGGNETTSGNALLKYLFVTPGQDTAAIQFGTYVPAVATVYWGETRDYELGSSISSHYESDHYVEVTDLTPSTHYFYKVEVTDALGRHFVVDGKEFTTLPAQIFSLPTNVSNFRATPSQSNITLTWNNPKNNFAAVRIVKSDKFYPRDPSDGEVIYEGSAEKFVDADVIAGKTYYYTAFTEDGAGNFSSGAVTDGRVLLPGEQPTEPQLFAGVLQLSKDLIHPLLQAFTLADIDFIQDGKKLVITDKTVEIRGDRNLTISIAYEKVPEILKTIAITMYDPDDHEKTFSFLLRVNKDKTAYEANIAAFDRSGKYEFALGIMDHKNQGLGLFAGTIVSRLPYLASDGNQNIDWFSLSTLWFLVFVLVLVAIVFVLIRIKRKNISAIRPAIN